MSDPICYFEFDNHQRVQIRALETVGVVLERADRGGACHEFLVTYYWEGQRRAEWMRPFELADEPKKARSMIAPPSEAAATADESLCPAPVASPAAVPAAGVVWVCAFCGKGYTRSTICCDRRREYLRESLNLRAQFERAYQFAAIYAGKWAERAKGEP